MANTDRKNKAIIILIIVLLILTTAGAVILGYFTYGYRSWNLFKSAKSSDSTNQTMIDDELVTDIASSPQITLYAGPTIAVTSADNEVQYLEKTLTATVYPEDATNKEVDWTIKISDINGEYTDGYEIIPESDGSCTAVLRFYKEGYNRGCTVTVTTREGNHTATCHASARYTSASVVMPDKIVVLGQLNGNLAGGNGQNEGGFYTLPLYCTKYVDGEMSNDTFALYSATVRFKDRLGSTMSSYGATFLPYDIEYRISFSSGSQISATAMNFSCKTMTTKYDDYDFKMTFNIPENVANEYRNKIKTNPDEYICIDFYNTFFQRSIGSIKLRFTIPTESVSVSETTVSF